MDKEGTGYRHLRTESAGETFELGLTVADLLRPGDVVLLVGELGTGKTCFTQGIARGIGVEKQVTSPTYTIMREYQGRIILHHLDAYRLEGPADLYDIGVDEYLEGEGIIVVEWGERVRNFFDPEYLEVRLDFAEADDERHVRLLAHGSTWENRLQGMQEEGNRHGTG